VTLKEQLGRLDNASDNYIKWPQPVPFDHIDTPSFPVESLPRPVAAFVEAISESMQTPDEMAGVLSLGILATAFQCRYELEVTSDWKEPLCLYPVAVAPPGERKSAVIAALTAPAYEYEAMRGEDESVEVETNRAEKDILSRTLEALKTSAVKGKTPADREQAKLEVLEITRQLAGFKDKSPYRLFADDTTPEKLIDLMDMQGGSITVASAEGGVFDSLSGRYDKGASLDVYLKGHAGDPIIVDRIGRKSNNIKHPRLTMMLTIQPEVLTGLMGSATFRGRGLCGRFLYVMCQSAVGHRNVNPSAMQHKTKKEYHEFVRRILSSDDTGIIRLSAEAHEIRLSYLATIETRLGNEWEHMRDWGGKLAGAMLRIAALIHAAEAQRSPVNTPISADVLMAAVKIAECLGAHAMAAYQIMGADASLADAQYLWKRIQSSGSEEIPKRDLIHLTRGKFHKASDMEPALQALIEMNYIRREVEMTGERGRPKETILVSPYNKYN
jgi:hypothetical protein